MSDWNYKPGDWWIHCDVCGKKLKASDTKKRWDGFIVCAEDYETRHSQDFVRAKPEKISVPFTRKQPDVFVAVNYPAFYWDYGYTKEDYISGDNI